MPFPPPAIKNALRQQNLNPDIEEKLLNLQRYQEQQLKDGADAPFTYTPIYTAHTSTPSLQRKRVVRKHHDDDDDDLDEELDDGAIPEDEDDEDWFAHKRRRKPYVPKTDRKSFTQRNSSPFIKPKHEEMHHGAAAAAAPPRLVQTHNARHTVTSTPVAIKPQPHLVTLKPKQTIVGMAPAKVTATTAALTQQKVMKVQHQNAAEPKKKKEDLSDMLATESEKLRDSMLKKRESLEQELKMEVDQEYGSTLQEMKQMPAGNQENETVLEGSAKYSSRKRASGGGAAAIAMKKDEGLHETPSRASRLHSTSKGGINSAAAVASSASSASSPSPASKKGQRSHGGATGHPSSSKKKEKLYCVCQTPYDDSK